MVARRLSASRARSSRFWPSASRACSWSFEAWLLELAGLDLDPLLGGGHLGDAAADLLDVLELLLVGEVEGVAGVLDPVEQLVGLGPEDVQKPLECTHRMKEHRGGSSLRSRAELRLGRVSHEVGAPESRSGRGRLRAPTRALGAAVRRRFAGDGPGRAHGRAGHDRRVP